MGGILGKFLGGAAAAVPSALNDHKDRVLKSREKQLVLLKKKLIQSSKAVPGGFQTISNEGVVKFIPFSEQEQSQIDAAKKASDDQKSAAAGSKKDAQLKSEEKYKPIIVRKSEKAKQDEKINAASRKKEEEALGVQRGAIAVRINDSASAARNTKPKINRIKKALDAVETGKYSQAKTLLGKFIPGMDVAKSEASAEFGKSTEGNKLILDSMLLELDQAIDEESQFKRFKKMGGDALNFEFEPIDFSDEEIEEDVVSKAKPAEKPTDTTKKRRGRNRKKKASSVSVGRFTMEVL